MSEPEPPSFRENDLQLLETGNFADGTVKCKGRTWKVHKALLASRLKFFKAAFYGSFVEATSGEVDLPESDPDSVDIMIRHLYCEGIDVRILNTPALCVRCWKLADYVQLESFKSVAISTLKDHLDAMVLLAANDQIVKGFKPKWLRYFFEAFREVCAEKLTKPLRTIFITFLWVARINMVCLKPTSEMLETHPEVSRELLERLVYQVLNEGLDWIPQSKHIVHHIHTARISKLLGMTSCSGCSKEVNVNVEPRFYNPFPIESSKSKIGDLMWCKQCVAKMNEDRSWPWRTEGSVKRVKVKVEAWAWSDDE